MLKQIYRSAACVFLMLLGTAPLAAQELVPLNLYYSQTRTDNISTADTRLGDQAVDEGFRFVRTSACLFREAQGSTVPVQTRYSSERRNHVTSATDATRTRVVREGFRPLESVGHIYPSERPGTVALTLYWNRDRQDYFLAVTPQEIRDAEIANYELVRIEGYALPATACTGTRAPVTDGEYVMIIDKLTCTGECRLGRTQLVLSNTESYRDASFAVPFELREEGEYNVSFGKRFSDVTGSMFWQVRFLDRRIDIERPDFRIVEDGQALLGGRRTRAFETRLRGRNLTRIEIAYSLYRASP